MIAYIKGILAQSGLSSVIVEAHGMGYRIIIPTNSLEKLPSEGKEVFFHTSFIVREQSQTLYGFVTASERELFEALLNVSGIGPKLAMALIGHLSVYELQRAINGADIFTLSKVPGIGKRTAERLIVELRDKLPALFPRDINDSQEEASDGRSLKLIRDALSALINLGYTQAMAKKAIQDSLKDLPEEADLPSLITAALKNI